MTKHKWKSVHEHLIETGDTIAVELIDGSLSYYCPKTGLSVNGQSVKAMLSRDLLRPSGACIDPEFPQAYEAVGK